MRGASTATHLNIRELFFSRDTKGAQVYKLRSLVVVVVDVVTFSSVTYIATDDGID